MKKAQVKKICTFKEVSGGVLVSAPSMKTGVRDVVLVSPLNDDEFSVNLPSLGAFKNGSEAILWGALKGFGPKSIRAALQDPRSPHRTHRTDFMAHTSFQIQMWARAIDIARKMLWE